MDYKSVPVGAVLSLLCSIFLITSWYLIPRWRTLLNYICMNQIIAATLHLWSVYLLEFNLSEEAADVVVLLNGYLFLASLCWSLCAAVVSYCKLVLVYPTSESSEKRKATAFSFAVLLIAKLSTDVFIPKMFQFDNYVSVMCVRFVPVYMITVLNLFMFVKIMCAMFGCGASSAFMLRRTQVIALAGVGSVCDVLTSFGLLMFLVNMYRGDEASQWLFVLDIRTLPLASVLVFNRRSRDAWRNYFRQRRRVKLNTLDVENIPA